jgi:hypothetical protein
VGIVQMADEPLELELELELELDDVVVLSGSDEHAAEKARVKPRTTKGALLYMMAIISLNVPDANENHHQQRC